MKNTTLSKRAFGWMVLGMLVSTAGFATQEMTLVPTNDPNLFLTPENWVVRANDVATNNPGAYLKIGFTGTSFKIVVDTSAQMPSPPPPSRIVKTAVKPRARSYAQTAPTPVPVVHEYESLDRELPKIGYQIDGGDILWRVVPTAGPSVVMTLASNLTEGEHQIKVSLEGLGKDDRWNYPLNQLKIKNFFIDENAKTIPAALLPKRMVVYGDSITEGANVYRAINRVTNKQWSESWDARLADRMNAEVSVIAFQAQGFRMDGQGNVPAIANSFREIRRNVPRAFSKPDYVMILEGTNGDAWDSDVNYMISMMRKSYPEAKIFFGVPFNGSAKWSIRNSCYAYSKNDPNLFFFDLEGAGQNAARGYSDDGIHPNPRGHEILAEMIFQLIFAYL